MRVRCIFSNSPQVSGSRGVAGQLSIRADYQTQLTPSYRAPLGPAQRARARGIEWPAMLTRVVAAFLVLLLCWSEFATQEQSVGLDGPAELLMTQGSATDSGSVDEHHLDDQPGQASTDATGDVPDWFSAPGEVVTRSSGRIVPANITSPQHTFSADTPRRPPRST